MTELTRATYRNVIEVYETRTGIIVGNGPPDQVSTCWLRFDAITSWETSQTMLQVFCGPVWYQFSQRPARNPMEGDYEPHPNIRRLETILMEKLATTRLVRERSDG